MILAFVIFIPLIGFVFTFVFDYLLGSKSWLRYVPTSLLGINACLSILVFNQSVAAHTAAEHRLALDLGEWINSGLFEIRWEFYCDNLTATMLFVVNVVSFMVHIYSLDYMAHDPNQNRFMAYLSLFTFFMIILVTGDNFIILFLGWEGVGLCSFLLISFWYTRVQANKSAIKALVVNRISDFGLTVGLVCIYFVFKSLNFAVVFPLAPFFYGKTFMFLGFDFDILSTIAILIFFGACGKSAQIGLHTWLPDAMEGPTPVSALIHAATMVTAGVFLIIKCSPIFEYAPTVLTILVFIGALTAFFAASIGLVQTDIKKVIAYSTCSQLGYMVFACGLSNYHVSFFHLVNHAFFKALLFLSAGAIIHSLSNDQDMRRYGALLQLLPFCAIMLLIGSLALMGIPFLTGFYSKDLILEVAYAQYTLTGTFSYWLGLVTAAFTTFYSYRVFYLTFLCQNNSYKKIAANIHELPVRMAVALMVLAFGSIFFGYLMKDFFVGFGSQFLATSIFILPQHANQIEAEFIPHLYKIFPFFLSLISVSFANFIFESHLPWHVAQQYNLQIIYRFLSAKWYFDSVYNRCINVPLLDVAYYKIFKLFDKGVLELVGPQGLSTILIKFAAKSKFDQGGEAYRYAGFMLFSGSLFIITYSFFI